ncbi:uncharacterized protein LOC125501093 [Athalia rosae]|uniref:uncharacterized protein LOC125501093 n=1 Tax=Athalia rosae TaxID=37344 RepID=UPI002033CCE6|nr:uncharacterized protein LOC125501093 [Athalia rosae]
MKMQYYSASGYEKLRRMGLKLPAERMVRRWVAETEVNVGFCEHVFAALKQAMLDIPPEERCCALKWDEMSLMEREEYDVKTDVIEGFEDLGPLGRTERRANHAFVFCLNGLHAGNQWRTMLAYFLPCNNVSGSDIVRLVRQCIGKISEAGADLKMTVCDQGTSNGKAYSELGVSEDRPHFFHEGKKIIALFDFPHAVKNVLGLFRKWGKISAADKVVAYSDFTNTFRSDLGCATSNLLGHITEAHMWPNAFERMNVSRAFQVFSKRFASAMELARHSRAVRSETIPEIARFCRSMDKIIDACNSSSIFNENPAKRPLSEENPQVEQILVEFLSWAPDMKVCAKGRWKRPASFAGMVQTVRGILMLYRQLREQFPGFKLCTALCNQDSVEQLFSRFRGRGGSNPNPTCRMYLKNISERFQQFAFYNP